MSNKQRRIAALCAAASACIALCSSAAPASAASHPFKVLYSFCAQANCPDGDSPTGLVADAAGNLYGTTLVGGANGSGTIFEMVRKPAGGYRYTILYNFCSVGVSCSDGIVPQGPVILDTSGNLYGTTFFGGAFGDGEVYELVRGNNGVTLDVLYSFCAQPNCTDGSAPFAALAYAGAANGAPYDGVSPLYGVTQTGGVSTRAEDGVAYALQPGQSGWTEIVLHEFCSQEHCADGAHLAGPLVEDPSGKLFGATVAGGSGKHGIAFELAFDGSNWTETVLHKFCSARNCADGSVPSGGLALDPSGNLFGGTSSGGNACGISDSGCGVLYQIDANGAESVIHEFCAKANCADGAGPGGALLRNGPSHYFGTSFFGGDASNARIGGGTLFEIGANGYHILHRFCRKANCTDGVSPAGLIRDSSGTLFGTTATGGANNHGTIYEVTP
jgi:uncharacterized repeat protein (TIGR03803 family)